MEVVSLTHDLFVLEGSTHSLAEMRIEKDKKGIKKDDKRNSL